jgi:hypothetical protein
MEKSATKRHTRLDHGSCLKILRVALAGGRGLAMAGLFATNGLKPSNIRDVVFAEKAFLAA